MHNTSKTLDFTGTWLDYLYLAVRKEQAIIQNDLRSSHQNWTDEVLKQESIKVEVEIFYAAGIFNSVDAQTKLQIWDELKLKPNYLPRFSGVVNYMSDNSRNKNADRSIWARSVNKTSVPTTVHAIQDIATTSKAHQ